MPHTKSALQCVQQYLDSNPKPTHLTTLCSTTVAPAAIHPPPPPSNPIAPASREQLLLPFYSHISQLNAALLPSGPTLLVGATGCGKSTQLPQHLLRSSPSHRIIVAQPRRLAATSIAARVSTELSTSLGSIVGYVIRGDSKTSSSTRCTFVTYGVLTRMFSSLSSPPWTHLVLDEVHERSSDLDLLLLFLKKMAKPPKIVLMSATVDTTTFSSYFPDLNIVTVPGRTFPVTRYYLEDAIKHTNYICGPDSPSARPNGCLPDTPAPDTLAAEISSVMALLEEANSETVKTNLGKRLALLTSIFEASVPDDPMTALLQPLSIDDTQTMFSLPSVTLARSLRTLAPQSIYNALISALIDKHIDGCTGDVLVFLPGLKEISTLQSHLETTRRNLLVLPLHSSLSTKEQHRVFLPSSNTKVILATTIAEASITVPSITLVIDTCLSRSQSLDPTTNLAHLTTHLASKSSIDQRAGRAGRVQEGTCYSLILKPTVTSLSPSPTPEILTTPLDTFSLRSRVLLHQQGSTWSLLSSLITPPLELSAENADASLVAYSALDASLSLTPYGGVLAQLPLSLPHARALVASHCLGCLDDVALLLAALTSPSSGFSVEDKKRADKSSDHVALLRLAGKSSHLRREASRLAKNARELLGSSDRKTRSALPLVLTSLFASSTQFAPFSSGSILYSTEARNHSLRPHMSSVLHGNNRTGYIFFGGVLKLPAGAMVMDSTVMGVEAVSVFTELVIQGVSSEEYDLLRRLKERIEKVVTFKEDGLALSSVLRIVLKNVVRDWSDLPEGWVFDDDRKIWVVANSAITQTTRPTESAAFASQKKESAKGSLARAEQELGGGLRKAKDRGVPPQTITSAQGSAKRAEKISERDAREAVKARLKAEEEKDIKKTNKSNVGALEKMLKCLELYEKYGGAPGIGEDTDTVVLDILGMVREGEKEEAEKGVESLIQRLGLVGGSASKVKRYCMGGGKAGGGKAAAATGGSNRQKGQGAEVQKGKGAAVQKGKGAAKSSAGDKKKTKTKKKKDDLSLLDGF